MQLSKFIEIRAFETTIYQRNLEALLAGIPIKAMPAFLTAGFVFDALRYASPEVFISGALMGPATDTGKEERGSLCDYALVIVQRGQALIGRYVAVENSNGFPGMTLSLQIYGHFTRTRNESLWPDHLVQLRTIKKTSSGTLVFGPVHFSERDFTFFTAILAQGAGQFNAHKQVLVSVL